jgi:hypothetical protein
MDYGFRPVASAVETVTLHNRPLTCIIGVDTVHTRQKPLPSNSA